MIEINLKVSNICKCKNLSIDNKSNKSLVTIKVTGGIKSWLWKLVNNGDKYLFCVSFWIAYQDYLTFYDGK